MEILKDILKSLSVGFGILCILALIVALSMSPYYWQITLPIWVLAICYAIGSDIRKFYKKRKTRKENI